MLLFPIGWANVIVIFGLCLANSIASQSSSGIVSTIIYLSIFWLFYKDKTIKKFLAYIFCTFIVVLYFQFFLKTSDTIQCKQKINSYLYCNKVFRTNLPRVGGIGHIWLKDGSLQNVYIHLKKSYTKLDDSAMYAIKGVMYKLKKPFNSNNFSYYLWSHNIRYHIPYAKLNKIYDQNPSLTKKGRQYVGNSLRLNFTKESRANVFEAILLGRKELLSDYQINNFFYTGTMHLFAVSGLHVGVVSTFFFSVCNILCFPKVLKLIGTAIGVFIYSNIVGFGPSTIRALFMVLFILIMQAINRPIDVKAAFLNTAFITLLYNPWQLWDVGFQLSYGVVAGIIGIGVPTYVFLKNFFIKKYMKKIPLLSSLCVSTSACIVSGIFSVYYWQLYTPWAFITNLFLIPLASFIVVLGATSCLLNSCLTFLAYKINFIAEYCIQILLKCVEILANLPLASIKISCNSHVMHLSLFLFLLILIKGFKPIKTNL